jgi:hypothetical protein
MSRYKWVYHGAEKLYEVGILPDGTLHNPRKYPDDIVRAAVLAADASATSAAVLRLKRQRLPGHIDEKSTF